MKITASVLLLAALGVALRHPAAAAGDDAPSAKECHVNGVTWGGLGMYLVGSQGEPDSIYGDCNDGVPTCYSDDGVADDEAPPQVACDQVTTPQKQADRSVFIKNKSGVWPQGVVCYTYASRFDAQHKDMFARAFQEYKNATGVSFLDVKDCAATFGNATKACNGCKHAVRIRTDGNGCNANVGYNPKGKQSLNLAKGCHQYHTYLHELGHVLGLIHEHSHPNRRIIVLRDQLNVPSHNYLKLASGSVQTLPYDIHSIMHYDNPSICLPKDPTLNFCDVNQTEKNGCVVPVEAHCDRNQQKYIGGGGHLTETDVAAVKKLYPNAASDDQAPGRVVANANATGTV